MKQTKANTTVARLKRQLKGRGITLRQVAAQADCSIPHVCNVLAGRTISRPVLAAGKALLAETNVGTAPPPVESDGPDPR